MQFFHGLEASEEMRTGFIWPDILVPVNIRAAWFWTACSIFKMVSDTPNNLKV